MKLIWDWILESTSELTMKLTWDWILESTTRRQLHSRLRSSLASRHFQSCSYLSRPTSKLDNQLNSTLKSTLKSTMKLAKVFELSGPKWIWLFRRWKGNSDDFHQISTLSSKQLILIAFHWIELNLFIEIENFTFHNVKFTRHQSIACKSILNQSSITPGILPAGRIPEF